MPIVELPKPPNARDVKMMLSEPAHPKIKREIKFSAIQLTMTGRRPMESLNEPTSGPLRTATP